MKLNEKKARVLVLLLLLVGTYNVTMGSGSAGRYGDQGVLNIEKGESIKAKIPNINFEEINKNNILHTYKKFVKKVKANYNKYTSEEAQEILDLWDKLNKIKDDLEPIAASVNKQIAVLKMEFAAVKVGLNARLNL